MTLLTCLGQCFCRGAKTDIKNMDGKTALEVAELNDQTEAAELLKEAQDVKPEA